MTWIQLDPDTFFSRRIQDPNPLLSTVHIWSEMKFKEFEPRFKSAKTRFKLSAGLNLETFDKILSGTNHHI